MPRYFVVTTRALSWENDPVEGLRDHYEGVFRGKRACCGRGGDACVKDCVYKIKGECDGASSLRELQESLGNSIAYSKARTLKRLKVVTLGHWTIGVLECPGGATEPALEHLDQLGVGIGVGAVAGLEVGETVEVVLLGEGVGGLFGDDHVVAKAEGVGGGVAHAHVGVEAGHHNGLDTELAEEDVKVGLEESAVSALRNNIVFVREFKFGNDLGAFGAGDSVVAPDLELTVNPFDVSVVAEDHGNASGSCRVKKLCGGWYDRFATVTGQRAGDEVIQHIHYKDSRLV